jgi:hypothetical protein
MAFEGNHSKSERKKAKSQSFAASQSKQTWGFESLTKPSVTVKKGRSAKTGGAKTKKSRREHLFVQGTVSIAF